MNSIENEKLNKSTSFAGNGEDDKSQVKKRGENERRESVLTIDLKVKVIRRSRRS